MATRCNIAVLLTREDRKRQTVRFNPTLIEHVHKSWESREKEGLPTLDKVPYRPVDISGIPEGKVIRIYCQFDGYPKGGVGETLVRDYGTKEKALNLVIGGNCENICTYMDTDGTWRCGYENWAMSGRDKGQEKYVPQDRLFKIEDSDSTKIDGKYMYLFRDGTWYVHHDSQEYINKVLKGYKEVEAIPFWISVKEYIEKDLDDKINHLKDLADLKTGLKKAR